MGKDFRAESCLRKRQWWLWWPFFTTQLAYVFIHSPGPPKGKLFSPSAAPPCGDPTFFVFVFGYIEIRFCARLLMTTYWSGILRQSLWISHQRVVREIFGTPFGGVPCSALGALNTIFSLTKMSLANLSVVRILISWLWLLYISSHPPSITYPHCFSFIYV